MFPNRLVLASRAGYGEGALQSGEHIVYPQHGGARTSRVAAFRHGDQLALPHWVAVGTPEPMSRQRVLSAGLSTAANRLDWRRSSPTTARLGGQVASTDAPAVENAQPRHRKLANTSI